MEKFYLDKDGFFVTEQGNYSAISDGQGNYEIHLGKYGKVKFNRNDKFQVLKAISSIGEILSRDLSKALHNYQTISLNNESLKKKGIIYNDEGLKVSELTSYLDLITKYLKYFGGAYGFDFEYLTYIEYKNHAKHAIISAKVEFYNIKAFPKSVAYFENWCEINDQVYAEKKQLFDANKKTDSSIEKLKKSEQNTSDNSNTNVMTNEKNPHPKYFINKTAFELFEDLQSSVREGKELADYSFIFRKMHKDEYIYNDIKERGFRDWLYNQYEIIISTKLKLLEYCKTESKNITYNNSLKSYKP